MIGWLRIARRVAAVAISVLLLYLTVTFGQVWWASTRDEAGPADAIVVLGAAQYDGRPSPALQRRLDHAVELYDAGHAGIIVVTGGGQEGDRTTEAAASAAYLHGQGIPDERIRREVNGTNSWESLAAAARFLADEGITDVLLVSDDYHALRIAEISAELGLDAAVSPVGSGLSVSGQVRVLGRETMAVAVGRVISFRRLMRLDETVERVRAPGGGG